MATREPVTTQDRAGDRPDESGPRFAGFRVDPGAIAAWLIPAVLVFFLSLENGGYDLIPLSQVGVAVWWLILVAAIVGFLPGVWRGFPNGLLIALLAAFAAWTALSFAWTESDERTMIELARVVTYLGVFVLGLAIQARGYGRQALNGTTTAVAVVIVLALLSRLEPNAFPEQTAREFLPDVQLESRLAYPLNYSTGLAVFGAMGLPLLLAAATSGRTAIGRYLAPAVLPIAALTLWLTGSSLALPLGIVTVLAYLLLTDERIRALAVLAVSAVGGAILILEAESREALDRGLTTPTALDEGDGLLVIAIVVCAAVVVGQFLLVRAFDRWPRLGVPPIPVRVARTALAVAAGLVVVIALAAGAAGEVSERWDDFRSAEGLDPDEASRGEQLVDVSARGRYQYWASALDAYETEPVLGIGPGSFEFWWAREGDPDAAIFVREAHSLYFESLAELGPLGLLLIGAFVVVLLARGALRAFRSFPADRPLLAAAVAACFAFAAAAAVDWVWELGVLPVTFLLIAAVAIGRVHPGETRPGLGGPPRSPIAERVLTVVVAIAALVAIAIPFGAESSVDESREAVEEERLDDALTDAQDAVAIEPFAATPRLQEAAVLERLGELPEAVESAREATEKEPTNWRPWLALSRLEAQNGNPDESVAAFEEAQSLFPRLIGG
jgi:tetratricopeptide (TPR) repeat protein